MNFDREVMINIRLPDYGPPTLDATLRSLEGRSVKVDSDGRMTADAMWEINERLRPHGMRVSETAPDGTRVPPMMVGGGEVLIEPIPTRQGVPFVAAEPIDRGDMVVTFNVEVK